MNLIYKNIAIGPEMIATTYRGDNRVDTSHVFGLSSYVERQTNIHISKDENHRLYVGMGLWGLLTLRGDQVDLEGAINLNMPLSLRFYNPVDRYNHFEKMVARCREIGEGFGIMSEVIIKSDQPNSRFNFFREHFGSALGSGVAASILEWLIPSINLKDFIYGENSTLAFDMVDLRFNSPLVCRLNQFGNVLAPEPDDKELFRKPLQLLDKFDKQKLDIAAEIVASENSPVHRYSRGLVIGKKKVEYLTPLNRHDDDVEIVVFSESRADKIHWKFGYVGTENKVIFVYGKEEFHGIYQVNFPKKIRLEVTSPHLVLPTYWNFITNCVEHAEWQVSFPNLQYLAEITKVTEDQARQIARMQTQEWQSLQTLQGNEIMQWTFFDTTSDLSNPKLEIGSSGFVGSL